MQRLRRYASYVAVLVFLTGGPFGALHIAREPGAASAPVSADSTVRHAHLPSAPLHRDCVACHLLQHLRVPVQVTAVLGDDRQPDGRHVASDLHPPQIALGAQLPARAPPLALA